MRDARSWPPTPPRCRRPCGGAALLVAARRRGVRERAARAARRRARARAAARRRACARGRVQLGRAPRARSTRCSATQRARVAPRLRAALEPTRRRADAAPARPRPRRRSPDQSNEFGPARARATCTRRRARSAAACARCASSAAPCSAATPGRARWSRSPGARSVLPFAAGHDSSVTQTGLRPVAVAAHLRAREPTSLTTLRGLPVYGCSATTSKAPRAAGLVDAAQRDPALVRQPGEDRPRAGVGGAQRAARGPQQPHVARRERLRATSSA